MAEKVREMQSAIKQQADDLRDELNDLAKWESTIKGGKKGGGSKDKEEANLPPIRGTAPMVKAAAKPKADPSLGMKEEGNEYFKKGQYEEAIRMYSKGIGMDPQASSSHVLYANRALCHLKLTQWELAEKDATSCIQMNRTYSKAFYRRALARKALKNLSGARTDLETVLVLSPGDSDSQKELAALTAVMKEEKVAREEVKTVKKKLVIQEVDDDDDDEEEEEEDKAAAAAEEEKQREAQREAETRRVAEEDRQKQLQFKKTQESAKAKVKKNAKIEEIEDDEESPQRARTSTGGRKSAEQPKPRIIESSKVNLDTTPVPKSFTEFERVYNETKKDEAVFAQYLATKLDAATIPVMFGSSLSEPIFVAMLTALCGLGQHQQAKDVLTALSKVQRMEELVMFLDDGDKDLLRRAIASTGVGSAVKSKFDIMM